MGRGLSYKLILDKIHIIMSSVDKVKYINVVLVSPTQVDRMPPDTGHFRRTRQLVTHTYAIPQPRVELVPIFFGIQIEKNHLFT